jgi:hypothetical protein
MPLQLILSAPMVGSVVTLLSLGAEPEQFKLAIAEAAEGKLTRSLADIFIQMCYMYDPEANRYTASAPSHDGLWWCGLYHVAARLHRPILVCPTTAKQTKLQGAANRLEWRQ